MDRDPSQLVGRAVHKVIAIPLLTDLICQQLQPWHFANAVLVSRSFHEAFLEHRWRTLNSVRSNDDRPNTIFPLCPSKEVEEALVRYGARFARHVVLPHSENRLGYALLQEGALCKQLRTLKQVGHRRAAAERNWMHWDEMDDNHSYKESEFVGQVDTATLSRRILTLAEQNRLTLQSLHLEGFVSTANTPLPFVPRLIQLLPTLESLEVLVLGPIPMENIVDVILHLPDRVQELTLKGQCNDSFWQGDFETTWLHYQNQLFPERLSPPPTARSLLETMEVKLRLTRLSCTNIGHAPSWVLFEILRHCPNLVAFKAPSMDAKRMSELADVLRVSRIEELNLILLGDTDWCAARILRSLLRANDGEQPPLAPARPRGLRSLTLNCRCDLYDGKRSLAMHYPTLERISIVHCGSSFDSKSVLQLLEQCPRLETFITIGSSPNGIAMDRPGLGVMMWDSPRTPTVDWFQFLFSGEVLKGSEDEMEEDMDVTLAQRSMPKEILMVPRVRLSWPCTPTLRVLSLNLKITKERQAERFPFYFTAVYKRFGQLEALEDLTLDCNEVMADFDPWVDYNNYNKKEDEDPYGPPWSACRQVSLDLSLRQGLCHMSRLKRLKRLMLLRPSRARVGPAEIEWIKEHWPQFESLPGITAADKYFC